MYNALNSTFGIDDTTPGSELPISIPDFLKLWNDGLMGTGVRMLLGSYAKFVPGKEYTRVCNQIHSFAYHFVEKFSTGSKTARIESGKRPAAQAFLDYSDDKKLIGSQLIQGILGQQETSSSLVGNAVDLLAKSPILWSEVVKEVNEKGDSLLTYDALRDNKLIQNILSESRGSIS